ncbi:MAG TPA: MFS transporter [Isosphaeraceae bacterium]|jgi:MFS family permease|nr:MFS transporter [Isosphaeraceae bacterium]
MRIDVRVRLAVMMALLYAVQGAWWPVLTVHLRDLGIGDRARGWIFATMAIAALASPLVAGHIADRQMAMQKMLALIYAVGTGLLLVPALGLTGRAGPLFGLFLAYWLLVVPGLALSSALALRNLERPGEQFGGVRLWGTVGWMAVGWVVSLAMAATGGARGASAAFGVAAVLSGCFSLYCLTLPHTPPLARSDVRRPPGLGESLELVRRRGVGPYLASAFGVSVSTAFIYQVMPGYFKDVGVPRPWIATAMTLGQVLEVVGLVVLPRLLRRLGFRRTLALGVLAYVVRFATLAAGPPAWLAVGGGLLQGLGYACFSVGGQVFLDREAPVDRRAGAQALNVVATTGLGNLLGNLLAGEVAAHSGGDYRLIFLAPAVIDVAVLGLVLVGLPGERARRAGPARRPAREAGAAVRTS